MSINYERISDLIYRLNQAEQIKEIVNEQIRGLISDLVKEYSVITNELLAKIARHSKVEAIKLYRDREGCNLKEAMEAIGRMVSK
jgi:ribosomal protein L7/L12